MKDLLILRKYIYDGTPCAVKVARTVWSGGKVGDNLKDLPITILYSIGVDLMGVKIELDSNAIAKLTQATKNAAVSTMNQLYENLVNNSMTMPFDTGDMQNNQTFVAVEGDSTVNGEDTFTVSLVTGSPQARRLYYHPEYNFQQTGNPNAGADWLKPYLKGGKQESFIEDTYSEILKKEADL